MTTVTVHASVTRFDGTAKPMISSPLASNVIPPTRPIAKRNLSFVPTFPTSRPLRPFPSISIPGLRSSGPGAKKPTKIIEPPKNFRGEFVLNLTQAELGRQD